MPGDPSLTVGGAIAADVHGKNHLARRQLRPPSEELRACTPADGAIEVCRESEGELFEATIGGMGLTGVITAATLRRGADAHPLRPGRGRLGSTSLDRALELMSEPSGYSHAIAWLDLLAAAEALSGARW